MILKRCALTGDLLLEQAGDGGGSVETPQLPADLDRGADGAVLCLDMTDGSKAD
jgi:hypothetical protein